MHRHQYPVDERIGHVLVKQVRHRADEIGVGSSSERLAEAAIMQSQIEALA